MSTQEVIELRGRNYLRRLCVFLDVVYALLFVQLLQYLPQTEDLAWKERPLGLLQLLIDNATELLRILIGCGLTIIYWNLSNRLLGSLQRTDGSHAVLVMLQMAFVCLFLYFAISDPALAGGPSSPALQSASLAIAGFIGLCGWAYARRHRLIDGRLTEQDQRDVARRAWIEPLTALLNTPLAFVGPMSWTGPAVRAARCCMM